MSCTTKTNILKSLIVGMVRFIPKLPQPIHMMEGAMATVPLKCERNKGVRPNLNKLIQLRESAMATILLQCKKNKGFRPKLPELPLSSCSVQGQLCSISIKQWMQA